MVLRLSGKCAATAFPMNNRPKAGLRSEKPQSNNHCEVGRQGEDLAWQFLAAKGCRLLNKNFRFGRQEIDLIVEDPNKVLVFVEVKTNRSHQHGSSEARVNGLKIRRIQRVAQRFCWQTSQADREMRFDVIGIEDFSGNPIIQHLENAFLPDAVGYFPSYR